MLSFKSTDRILELMIRRQEAFLDKPPTDKGLREMLIMLRFLLRDSLERYNLAVTDLRYYEHRKKVLAKQGISVIFLDAAIAGEEKRAQANRDSLRNLGEIAITFLDLWQVAGASREELFSLCGVFLHTWPEWKKRHLANDPDTMPFSKLVAVYNLDYPENGDDFLRDEADAPFTHAIKEYMLYQMLHTEEGRIAAHKAMKEVFPGLMEHCMMLTEDGEGRKVLLDKDGCFIRYLDEEA